MKRIGPTAGIIVTLVLGGAWVTAALADHPQPSLGDPAPDVASAAQVQPESNLPKLLGEPGVLVSDDNDDLFEITVTSVERARTCPSRTRDLEPVAGDFLVVNVTARLAGEVVDASDSSAEQTYFPLMPETFRIYDSDGAELTAAATVKAWECFADDELLPSFIFPGDSVAGRVVLETTAEAGAVAYQPGGAPGWEWNF